MGVLHLLLIYYCIYYYSLPLCTEMCDEEINLHLRHRHALISQCDQVIMITVSSPRQCCQCGQVPLIYEALGASCGLFIMFPISEVCTSDVGSAAAQMSTRLQKYAMVTFRYLLYKIKNNFGCDYWKISNRYAIIRSRRCFLELFTFLIINEQ